MTRYQLNDTEIKEYLELKADKERREKAKRIEVKACKILIKYGTTTAYLWNLSETTLDRIILELKL